MTRQGSRVLVTGGTGFVGKAVVRRLIADGYRVRVLARQQANVEPVVRLGAEVHRGDVADPVSFGQAFQGCELVVHLAAGTSGSERDSATATLIGTRTLLDLCRQHKPKRLVYISSCSVYGVADYARNALVPETASLERFPERRGVYSASKQQAEGFVTDFIKTGDVPVVILRPGAVWGPGTDLYSGMMGFSFGSLYIVIGMGALVLPLVHVDNLAGAIARCLEKKEAEGEIFNVIDPERITKRQYINQVVRRVDRDARVFYLPYSVLYGITWMQELAFGLMNRRPVLTRYRLTSSQKSILYDAGKIAARLGWKPDVSLGEAIEQLVRRAAHYGPRTRNGQGRRTRDGRGSDALRLTITLLCPLSPPR
jgi:nucleoside-diphosphate-sugar epimerase